MITVKNKGYANILMSKIKKLNFKIFIIKA